MAATCLYQYDYQMSASHASPNCMLRSNRRDRVRSKVQARRARNGDVRPLKADNREPIKCGVGFLPCLVSTTLGHAIGSTALENKACPSPNVQVCPGMARIRCEFRCGNRCHLGVTLESGCAMRRRIQSNLLDQHGPFHAQYH